MSENSEAIVSNPQDKDLGKVKEIGIDEIQKEIIAQIAERLKDPRAIELSYMVGDERSVHLGKAQPEYEHGSKRRFLVIDNSHLGTDQLCIALMDNRASLRPRSRGASIGMAAAGNYSTREISLSRFIQTPNQRIMKRNAGTCYLLLLSEGVPQRLGTVSIKSEASPDPRRDFSGNKGWIFAERWRNGEAQLVSYGVYDMAGQRLDFQEQDYTNILKALKSGWVNPSMTQKVAEAEHEYRLAKVHSRQLPSG